MLYNSDSICNNTKQVFTVVYRNSADLHVDFVSVQTLLHLFITFLQFYFWNFKCLHMRSCHLWMEIIFLPLFQFRYFILFPANTLARTSLLSWRYNGKCMPSCLFLNVEVKFLVFCSSTWCLLWIFIYGFIVLCYFPPVPIFFSLFFMKLYWSLWNAFPASMMFLWGFPFTLHVVYNND